MPIQNAGALDATASGFKHLSHFIASHVSQAANRAAGLLAERFPLETVKKDFFPENEKCDKIFDQLSSLPVKDRIAAVALLVISAPVQEEIMRDWLVQEGLLTKTPRMLFELFGKGYWVDSNIARIARVGISSAVAAVNTHLLNKDLFGLKQEELYHDIAQSFGFGLVSAGLLEVTGSIGPAIVLLIAWKAIAGSIPLISCLTRSSAPKLIEKTESQTLSTNGTCPVIGLM